MHHLVILTAMSAAGMNFGGGGCSGGSCGRPMMGGCYGGPMYVVSGSYQGYAGQNCYSCQVAPTMAPAPYAAPAPQAAPAPAPAPTSKSAPASQAPSVPPAPSVPQTYAAPSFPGAVTYYPSYYYPTARRWFGGFGARR